MILVEVCLIMHGKASTVLCLLMAKLALENLTQWLDIMQTKVRF